MGLNANKIVAAIAPVIVGAVLLTACGGGGGGGGGNSGGSSAFVLSSTPRFGNLNGAIATTGAFNVNTPSAATQVGASDFTTAVGTERNYLEFPFSQNVVALSITDGLAGGNDGIVLQDANGNNIRYTLDSTGAIDPTNAFPAAGIAPPLVRIYVNDPTLYPAAPLRLPAGQYTVSVIPTNLQSQTGDPFCVRRGANNICIQSPIVTYSFTIGGDTIAPTAAAAGVAAPVVSSIIPANQEIRVFFSEAIDFQSIAATTTDRDPFISRVFPVNNLAGGATSAGENIAVTYTAPPNTALPVNYGFVVYMPDPFHNPTEVRVRFVDLVTNQPSDAAPNVQSYGLDFQTYESAGFVAPVNANGQKLNLPPALPVPGSSTNGLASVAIVFANATSAFATDTSFTGDGVNGVTDRARNGLAAPITIGYTYQNGPVISNNPNPPDACFITQSNQVCVVSTGKVTTGSIPVGFGGTVTGQLNAATVCLDDVNVLGEALDIEFGDFVNFNSGLNIIHNSPRRTTIPLPLNDNNGDPAIPVPQGGNIPIGLLQLICPTAPPTPGPFAPIGLFTYICDGTHDELRVYESNSMTLLTTIVGCPNPGGVGITPDRANLYVSNTDQGTVQRIGSNPVATTTFHQVVNTMTVGAQPRSVSVNIANEDVFIVNSGDNTVSIVDVVLQTERTRLTVGAGPRDIFVTDRFTCMGCTFAYMAFITNFFDNSVSVYESDSPSNQVNNGPQGKIIDTQSGFQGPAYGCWNRWSNIGFIPVAMGAYIANSTGTTVENRGATAFGLSPQPGFQGQPGFRTFSTVAVYSTNTLGGASPADCSVDAMSGLPTTKSDNKFFAKADIQGGSVPSVLLVSYPAAGRVAAYDLNTPTLLGTVQVSGSLLYSYYDQ